MNIIEDLESFASRERAEVNRKFFKTGKGEYGEGDEFIGVTVPDIRKVAKKYSDLNLSDLKQLLDSPIHEVRLCALLVLVEQYNTDPEKIFNFYLKHTYAVNNWDLVDLSADKIVGRYLLAKDQSILFSLCKSKSLWERRISIIATLYFIKNNSFSTALQISELLLNDKHDLIHKAVGWMLREVGKRDKDVLISFLEKHSSVMPRTALRYSIEKFPEEERLFWLGKSPSH